MGRRLRGLAGFELGTVVATPRAREAFSGEYLASCVSRHASGDWGDLTEEDLRLNDLALKEGGPLSSFYRHPEDGRGLCIITEASRSMTILLLAQEYEGTV
jgi:hypothetical protein